MSVASGSGRGMSVLALVHGGALKFVLLREFHNDGVVLFDGALLVLTDRLPVGLHW